MAINTDFEIQTDKDIRYIGAAHGATGAGYYTVLAFHEWLRNLADDAQSATDDYMDITRATPSDKSYETIVTLLNGYNIDQSTSEHLYQGSIIQAGADDIWDGIQIIAAVGCHVEIVQSGAIVANDFWNSTPFGESTEGLNRDVPNGIACRFMLKVKTAGTDLDGRRLICQTREWYKTYSEFKVNGTGRGVNVVPLTYTADLNNTHDSGTASGYTGTLVTAGYVGIDVNNDAVNEYYYCKWTRGSNTINEFYEKLKYITRRGTSETLFGLNGELFRGITHEIDVDNQGATDFSAFEPVSWTGGAGQMLAVNDVNAATKMWIQLLSGVAPTDGLQILGGTSGATCDVNVTILERSLSFPFCGVSTGTALIGSYGFCLQATDLGSADKMFDLIGDMYQSPNYVNFTVGGLTTTDYVIVGPRGYRFAYDTEAGGPFVVGETLTFVTPSGTTVLADLLDLGAYGFMNIGPMLTGVVPQISSTIAGASATASVSSVVSNDIDLRQLTLNGALSGVAVTSVVVNEVIPADTPATGTIRIKRTSGKYTRHPYSARNIPTKTFTITSHDFSGDTAPNGSQTFISYIDTTPADDDEGFVSIYSAERTLFIKVRNGGATPIKTFETTGALGAAGGSSTAVRTSDA